MGSVTSQVREPQYGTGYSGVGSLWDRLSLQWEQEEPFQSWVFVKLEPFVLILFSQIYLDLLYQQMILLL